MFTNQTGPFPHRSSKGNEYLMIVYAYKANTILVEPLKNRKGNSLLQAYQQIYNQLDTVGFKPALHVLDNEASCDFKLFLKNNKLTSNSCLHERIAATWQKG